MAKAATSSLASKTSAVSGRHVSNVQVLYALAVVVVAVSSSHAHLFWARMRGESGCAEGARVGARPSSFSPKCYSNDAWVASAFEYWVCE